MDLYEAIYLRRDVRDFRPDPLPREVLLRILDAAHHAGSVGFMQPWNFLVIESMPTRRQIREVFAAENAKAAALHDGERRQLYDTLKLEGIVDAPLNVVVTCDSRRGGPAVLGRNSVPETDLYSTCCAVQNLWLAARAEGVGVGWVSILDHAVVKRILEIPPEVTLLAYLCIGYPKAFGSRPLLEEVGWAKRVPLARVVSDERWGATSRLFQE